MPQVCTFFFKFHFFLFVPVNSTYQNTRDVIHVAESNQLRVKCMQVNICENLREWVGLKWYKYACIIFRLLHSIYITHPKLARGRCLSA